MEDERATVGSMMPRPNPTQGQTRRETLPSGLVRWEIQPEGSAVMWHVGLGHVQRMPDYWELFSSSYGPTKALADSLGERREELRRAWVTRFEADEFHANGEVAHDREYLLVLGTRR